MVVFEMLRGAPPRDYAGSLLVPASSELLLNHLSVSLVNDVRIPLFVGVSWTPGTLWASGGVWLVQIAKGSVALLRRLCCIALGKLRWRSCDGCMVTLLEHIRWFALDDRSIVSLLRRLQSGVFACFTSNDRCSLVQWHGGIGGNSQV
jgi:hypothetical protein